MPWQKREDMLSRGERNSIKGSWSAMVKKEMQSKVITKLWLGDIGVWCYKTPIPTSSNSWHCLGIGFCVATVLLFSNDHDRESDCNKHPLLAVHQVHRQSTTSLCQQVPWSKKGVGSMEHQHAGGVHSSVDHLPWWINVVLGKWIHLPRVCVWKPWPFGNKCHTIFCALCGTLFGVEMCKGKDAPCQCGKPDCKYGGGKTVGSSLRLKNLFWEQVEQSCCRGSFS